MRFFSDNSLGPMRACIGAMMSESLDSTGKVPPGIRVSFLATDGRTPTKFLENCLAANPARSLMRRREAGASC